MKRLEVLAAALEWKGVEILKWRNVFAKIISGLNRAVAKSRRRLFAHTAYSTLFVRGSF